MRLGDNYPNFFRNTPRLHQDFCFGWRVDDCLLTCYNYKNVTTGYYMLFEWDDNKDHINQQKHGISFETASKIFNDPFLITI